MNHFGAIFLALLAAGLVVDLWLLVRHRRRVAGHRNSVPEAFEGDISLEQHRKAADYTLARSSVALLETLASPLLLLFWLAAGVSLLHDFWVEQLGESLISGTALFLSLFLISSLLELPFSTYRTFAIEARFGFNRTTPKRFILDLLLQSALVLVIGGLLISIILWLVETIGEYWWFAAWATWMAFLFAMMWAFPTVIAPLFNKFKPLADEQLRNRIEGLLERCGFRSSGVFVMDGSRRSSHGNAYFTGFGKARRIVFFDTLMENLEAGELEAVLAHELGHYKHKHIRNSLLISAGLSLLGFWLASVAIQSDWFYAGLGLEPAGQAFGLLLVLLVLPVFSHFLQPISSLLQRRNEFEADRFAVHQTGADQLIRALVKLYRDNSATLTPDPLYSAFHDSHPPAPVRIAHLQQQAG